MKILLKLEYFALFVFSVFLFSQLSYVWWVFPALLFVPDIGMVGYVIDPKVGAITYNLTHWLVIGFGAYVIGSIFTLPIVTLIGVIIIAHSAMDRVLGFGLKYTDSFKHTHLGSI